MRAGLVLVILSICSTELLAHSKIDPRSISYVDALDGGILAARIGTKIVFPSSSDFVFFQKRNGSATILLSEGLVVRGEPYCYLHRRSASVEQITAAETFQLQTHMEHIIRGGGGSTEEYDRRSDLEGADDSKIREFACYNGLSTYPANISRHYLSRRPRPHTGIPLSQVEIKT